MTDHPPTHLWGWWHEEARIYYPFRQPPEGADVLWRVEDRRYAACIDPDGDVWGSTPLQAEARWYHIRKRTPKGAWIGDRFILLTARKKFACETLEEAMKSFLARKTRQASIYRHRLKDAEQAMHIAKTWLEHAGAHHANTNRANRR